MIDAWNGHIQRVFIIYWISCSDKSMYVCMNTFICIVFFFCPDTPHPKVNKYHTICCSKSGIMYVWDIVKVRDHLIPMGRPKFDTSPNMKMVGLMIRLTWALWSAWKAVIMNSGLCVLKGFLEMRKTGIDGSALIKRGTSGIREFVETVLMIDSGQTYWWCGMFKWRMGRDIV